MRLQPSSLGMVLLAVVWSTLATSRVWADPICELDPPAIDFGPVPLGESADRPLTLRNLGDGLLVGNLSESCPDFAVVEPLPIFVIAGGDSATFTIRYTANTAGPVECTLATNSAECGNVPLTGYGELPPSCVVDPQTLDFGTVTVGAFEDRSFSITNSGEGLLEGTVALDPGCVGFALVDSVLSYSLPAAGSKTFTVRFQPGQSGPHACTVETGAVECADVSLSGIGELPPACALDPPGLDFGTVTIGESQDRTFSITNVGEGLLEGTVALDPGCIGFALVDSVLSYSLPAAGSKTFTVRFQPGQSGPHACTLETGAGECPDLPLSGIGELPPACSVDPLELDFGTVTVGEFEDRTFSITNVGEGLLEGTVALGSGCMGFALVDSVLSYSLPAAGSRTFTVRFQPTHSGQYSCTIETGAVGCPDVSASGRGEPPPACALDPAGLDFGSVTVGESLDRSFSITNVGGGLLEGTVALDPGCIGFALVDSVLSYSLPAAGSKTFTVRFQPAQSGPHACTVETGAGECPDLPLSGIGELPPACALDPAGLDFGTVTVGESLDRSFSITNVGEGLLEGTVALDPGCIGFALVDSVLSYSLPAAGSKTFTVRFQPAQSGPHACAVETGAVECPDLPLSGIGELPPGCSVEPMELDFGTVVVGQAKDLTFEITNTGEGVLSGTVFLGAVCSGFSLVDTVPDYLLGPGQAKVFTIRFAPPDSAAYACTLETGSELCLDLPLAGLGDSPPLCVVDPPTLDFGDVVVGEGAERSFTIRNDGGSVLSGTVTESCADFFLLDSPEYLLTAGQSRAFTLRFTPGAAGDQACDLDLGSADCPTYHVTGSGVLLPSCDVQPRDLDFGIVPVGESRDRSFGITNDGGGRLQGSFSSDCSEFTVVDATGYDLGPFESEFFTARYTPTGEGSDDCEIDLGGQCGAITVHGTGQLDPLCTVEPLELDFGSVLVGSDGTRTFTIRNDGGEVLAGTVVLSCDQFTLLEDPDYALTAGQFRLFTVRFAPLEEGPSSCTIDTGNALCSDVFANGTGVVLPVCSVEPAALDFGTVTVGESWDRSFSITNVGGGLLEGTVALDPGCIGFALVDSVLSYSLPAAGSKTFTVRFQPTQSGPYACTLESGSELCPDVPLSGFGDSPPLCTVEPLELDFGSVLVGSDGTRTFTIRNDGGEVLAGTVVLSCDQFTLLEDPDYALTAGQFRLFTVRFAPLEEGPSSCTIDTGNALCSDVFANGTGVVLPVCSVEPAALDFGGVKVGRSRSLPFTIRNDGGGVLEGAVAPSCGAFTVLGSTDYALLAGQSKSFDVQFAPTEVGDAVCALDLGHADCPELNLYGTGLPLEPGCAVEPPELEFGPVMIGESWDLSFTLFNTGETTLQGQVASPCADFDVVGIADYELAPSDSASFTIRFTPVALDSSSCLIDLGSESCGSILAHGNGVEEVGCVLLPTALAFGDVPVGSQAELPLRVENRGTKSVQGTLAIEGDCPGVVLVGASAYDLPPGEEAIFTVRFEPPDVGAVSCRVTSPCGNSEVTGRGVLPAVCRVTPEFVDFGTVILGNSAEREIVVANEGEGRLQGALTSSCAVFQVIGDAEFDLGGGETATFVIRFTPTEIGPAGCTLSSGTDLCVDPVVLGFAIAPPEPECVIEPASLEFGPVEVGRFADRALVIRNDGAGRLVGTLTPDCDEVRIEGDPSFDLGEGESRAFTARYAPTRPGELVCALRAAECASVPLHGTGYEPPDPVCGIFPASIDFGPVTVGQSSVRLVSISNSGGGVITGTLRVDLTAGFRVLGSAEVEVAAGQTVDYEIEFAPQVGGLAEAVLTVEGDPDLCSDVGLRGSGASGPGAACRAEPDVLEFGSVVLHEAATASFVVHNDGTSVLAGEVSPGCPEFSVETDPRFAIEPGGERSFDLVFAPTVEAYSSCTIDLGTPGCNIIARGRGVLDGEPDCDFDPPAVYFGSVEVPASVEQSVRVTNVGGGRLEGLPAIDCSAFSLLDASRLSLAGGEWQDLRVAFHPPSAQLFTCELQLGDACVTTLAGSGVTKSPALSVSTRLGFIGLSVRPSASTVEDVFGALGVLGRDFYLWSWSDAESAYVAAEPGTTLEPATGYWIRASHARSIALSGEPAPGDPYVSPLMGQGGGAGTWTSLANPFQFPVPLPQIFVARGHGEGTRVPFASAENDLTEPALWGWNGESYHRLLTLQPGQGFWIRKVTAEDVSLILEPNPFASATGAPLPLPEWTIALTARQGLAVSSAIEVGAAPVPGGEWNPLDVVGPPDPPERVISLAIPHPEWGGRAGRYQSDYQPERSTMVWDFALRGLDPDQPLELELASGDLPADVSLHLTYWDGRQRTLADAPGTATFHLTSDQAALRLVASFAPPDVIPPEAQLPGLVRDVPVAVPNPFGGATEIHFLSETTGPVVVTIFDAHGRRVRELRIEGSVGENALAWDGLDDRRNAVETGVYLVRIEEGSREQTLRLLRIR